MATPAGLREIAACTRWIGPDTSWVVPPSTLLADARATGLPGSRAPGLPGGAYTFRAENRYLPPELRRGSDPIALGDASAAYHRHFGPGADAVVTDFPAPAPIARDARAQRHVGRKG